MCQLGWNDTTVKADGDSGPAAGTGCLLQIHPIEKIGQLIELICEQTTLGRDDCCELCIPDTAVSRRHAQIERDGDGYLLKDLDSTNGTSVNEQRVRSARLNSGDRIQVGGFIYKFLSTNHIERQYHEAVYSMMTRDELTGTLNKRFFLDILSREFQRCVTRGNPLALVLFDIDNFKSVNDTFGHLIGDDVLRGLGKRVGGTICQHDVFARYGGEEFAILLPDVVCTDATKIAERCRQAVAADPFDSAVGPLRITISAGVADTRTSSADCFERLLQAADAKLYKAKRSGRNRVHH